MKTICLFIAAVLLAGCASPKSILKEQGKGTKWTYAAGYDRTWDAAVKSARLGELVVNGVDPKAGIIQASTRMRSESWGEVVAVWVRRVNADSTQVEVISKPQGPVGLFRYDWDQPILKDIAVQLELPTPLFPPKAPAQSPKGSP